MEPGVIVILVISFVVALGFIVGGIYNRSRVKKINAWFMEGLSQIGDDIKPNMLGFPVSGSRISIYKAFPPLEKGELIYLLESRENLPLLLVNHLQGIRDEMSLRATSLKQVKTEIEAGSEKDKRLAGLVQKATDYPFQSISIPGDRLIAWRGEEDASLLANVKALFEKYSTSLIRVSIRKDEPNLVVRARIDRLYPEIASGEILKETIRLVE